MNPLLILLAFLEWVSLAKETEEFSKLGSMSVLSSSSVGWGIRALESEQPPTASIDDPKKRQLAFQGKLSTLFPDEFVNDTDEYDWDDYEQVSAHRRLVEDLLDPDFYENTVHPSLDFRQPVRVNMSMSLYQILQVDERSQSLTVNVWMVQDWYDQFLDWDPHDYEGINKTILPYDEIWVPDTYLYNSESMEQKRTEALMNGIVETGYWRNDSRGAYVQLMFPAIYKLSCRMNVRFFPYDQQNCTFIISSWTHDSSTLDYYPKTEDVNMKNFAQNVEWAVVSFTFNRVEQYFKCCEKPWIMIYAHLVIQRKPLYYIINLVVPTSIITVVAVTGFFTPSSTSSERDEKLYLGINTLLTMAIMLLMISNKMPSTSTYVPLMGWYYMGIIFVIVVGTLLATMVLFVHSRKVHLKPVPPIIRKVITRQIIWRIILEPPTQLLEIWTEFGILHEMRMDPRELDPLVLEKFGPNKYASPLNFFSSISSQVSAQSAYRYERRLHSVTKQFADQVRLRERRERKRRETLRNAADFLTYGTTEAELNNSRIEKKKKMMRRCALEWEYLANVIDRVLLFIFCCITIAFFVLLAFFDGFYTVGAQKKQL
ncbi:unnamed protein product [Bursaphelenchus okinawaensis]|uniref:Uncharacterized protein n=1 Tax=Bursaphelenchus okinawaensis TaxID=465554 RepID=A0A811KIS8_9BILA|nr:unnamed protein product [Bursaphelenchus okinawaensis]CAG9103767.1 unnamed protein product [Bursaphelenchus okinawaensis]